MSNVASMLLFAAKVYASISSGSLAIVASTLDSLLDLLSGFILWFTAFSMQTPNPYRYPIGKKRMQPLGILVFASVVATLGLQITLEFLHTLVSDDDEFNLTKEQEQWIIGIMLSVTLVKLFLLVYCRTFANEIVKAYAQNQFFFFFFFLSSTSQISNIVSKGIHEKVPSLIRI
ncbi:metal tolerance protein 11-like [Olea europaea var. sylvestris]|uniref:metal tolerance protein 11-like n=1 Tax=Olea europaea var. sylvestris TaxID=158386 RepID=UPI000C1D14EF|nr:metal tolerance protein 11-like [Olea europaea var. sylvestris]